MSDSTPQGPGAASERNGLVPLLVLGAVAVLVYGVWGALATRPRSDPFGPWSDAHQVAPDPPSAPDAGDRAAVAPAASDEEEPGGAGP